MALKIEITADTPELLTEALLGLSRALGGARMGGTLAGAAISEPPGEPIKTTLLLDTPAEKPAPTPDPEPAPAPAANVAQPDLSPEDMRQKATDLLMTEYTKRPEDTGLQAEFKRLQQKYGVKKFGDVALDRAAEFYADASLVASGTRVMETA